MEVGDEQTVTTDALPPQDVPAPASVPDSQDNDEYVAAYNPDPVVGEVVNSLPAPHELTVETRPVRRSCRMAAALVRANNASAAANNNNDLAPKDLNSRHLFSQNHSKKVIKHALRQQAKRRRKNTTIASGHPMAPITRLVVKGSSLGCHSPVPSAVPKASTMQEVLASIPGFNLKHRKKTARKLSTAAQLEQTKEGLIDLETPDSIFAVLNLSKLLTQETLAQLPLLYQQKLLQLLPEVDRPSSFSGFKKDFTGLSNEFFAKACQEWRRRLAEGKFSSENQQKFKFESEKRRKCLDPWKSKHFEAVWGERPCEQLEDSFSPVPSTSSKCFLNLPPSLMPPASLAGPSKSSPSPCISPVVLAQVAAESPPVPASTPPPEEPSLPQKRSAEETESFAKKPKHDNSPVENENAQLLMEETSSSFDQKEAIVEENLLEEKKEEELSPQENMQVEEDILPEANIIPETDLLGDSSTEYQAVECMEPIPKEEEPVEKEEEQEPMLEPDDKIDGTVIETPISSIVVPLEQHQESNVESTNIFDMAQQISNESDADHNQVIEDVLKAEEEGAAKGMSSNDVHSELLRHADLLQAQFWTTDQISANLLGAASEQNTGHVVDREDNVEALTGDMELVVGQIVKDMGLNQSPIIMNDSLVNDGNVPVDCGEMQAVEWPMFGAPSSDLQQNMTSNNIQSQVPMYIPQKQDLMQDPGKMELEMSYAASTSSQVTAAMQAAVSMPSAQHHPSPYCTEQIQITSHQMMPQHTMPQPIFSHTQMQMSQPQMTGAPIMTPIPLSLPNQHMPMMQTPVPILSPNLRAQVISAVAPQTHIMPAVNCVAAVRHPINSSVPNMIPQVPNMLPQVPNMVPHSTSPSILQMQAKQPASSPLGNNSAALVGPSVKPSVKAKSQGGRGSRSTSKSTPPGAINLERSYQICQAVIQNSPNREQLQGQLKLPPSLLSNTKQTTVPSRAVSAAQQLNNRPRPPPKPAKLPVPPQNSNRMTSIVLRQVFTSSQGVPVTMAVLPQGSNVPVQARRNSNGSIPRNNGPVPLPLPQLQVVDKNSPHPTQYILVQRPTLPAPPRASSAPPVQPQIASHLQAAGRPASVDASTLDFQNKHLLPHPQQQQLLQPQPQIQQQHQQMLQQQQPQHPQQQQILMQQPLQNQILRKAATAQQQQNQQSCVCNLKAMIMCQKCGAYCHDDCITPNSRLCVTCHIR